MQSSSASRGFIIDPNRSKQSGATRRASNGAEGQRHGGNSETSQSAHRTTRDSGRLGERVNRWGSGAGVQGDLQTRPATPGQRGDTGQPGPHAAGQPGWCSTQGRLGELTVSRGRKIRNAGRPAERIVGDTERTGMRGNLRLGQSAPPKDGIRGDSKYCRRHKPEMQRDGQPLSASEARHTGDAAKQGNLQRGRNRQRGAIVRRGATRRSDGRHSQRTGEAGQPEEPAAGTVNACRVRGNPEKQGRP